MLCFGCPKVSLKISSGFTLTIVGAVIGLASFSTVTPRVTVYAVRQKRLILVTRLQNQLATSFYRHPQTPNILIDLQ